MTFVIDAFALNILLCYISDFHKYVSGLHFSILINAFLIPCLFRISVKSAVSKFIGGLSYPLFLSHWIVGAVTIAVMHDVPEKDGLHFGISLLFSIMLSALLYVLVDRKIQTVRMRVKQSRNENFKIACPADQAADS